jgi:hypothetical protein
MPNVPDQLVTATTGPIAGAVRALLSGGDADAFERDMQRTLTRLHTAAYLRGLAERSAGGKVREWLSKLVGARALSKADREVLKAGLAKQFEYLRGFVDALPGMSDAQIATRAALYAASVRQVYLAARWGDWDIDSTLLPGNQKCQSACRCMISIRDNGDGTGVLIRELGGSNHCDQCPKLVGEHPVKRRTV